MAEPMFRVTINDRDGLRRAITAVPKKFPRNSQKNMMEIAKQYRNNVVRAMTMTPRMVNVIYKRGRNVHHPSAPYFPPARDTNGLVDRMQVDEYNTWRSYGAIFFIKGAPYAAVLEDGNSKGTLKPRPVYGPELEKIRFQDRVMSNFAKDFK